MGINSTKGKRKSNMSAFTNKLKILRQIQERGGWETEKALMIEALTSSPREFSGLRISHVDDCISYGNSKLVDMGLEPVTARPEDDPGRCEDLWDEGPRSFMPGKWTWSEASKRLATIGLPEEVVTMAQPEDPEQHFEAADEIGFGIHDEFVLTQSAAKEYMNKYVAVEEVVERKTPEVDSFEVGTPIQWAPNIKRVAEIERRERSIEQSLRTIDDMAKRVIRDDGLTFPGPIDLAAEPEDDV